MNPYIIFKSLRQKEPYAVSSEVTRYHREAEDDAEEEEQDKNS
jgi:hypothetical protein